MYFSSAMSTIFTVLCPFESLSSWVWWKWTKAIRLEIHFYFSFKLAFSFFLKYNKQRSQLIRSKFEVSLKINGLFFLPLILPETSRWDSWKNTEFFFFFFNWLPMNLANPFLNLLLLSALISLCQQIKAPQKRTCFYLSISCQCVSHSTEGSLVSKDSPHCQMVSRILYTSVKSISSPVQCGVHFIYLIGVTGCGITVD